MCLNRCEREETETSPQSGREDEKALLHSCIVHLLMATTILTLREVGKLIATTRSGFGLEAQRSARRAAELNQKHRSDHAVFYLRAADDQNFVVIRF